MSVRQNDQWRQHCPFGGLAGGSSIPIPSLDARCFGRASSRSFQISLKASETPSFSLALVQKCFTSLNICRARSLGTALGRSLFVATRQSLQLGAWRPSCSWQQASSSRESGLSTAQTRRAAWLPLKYMLRMDRYRSCPAVSQQPKRAALRATSIQSIMVVTMPASAQVPKRQRVSSFVLPAADWPRMMILKEGTEESYSARLELIIYYKYE